MSNQLIITGHMQGDKPFEGNIPNLKLGDVRYYPQDNSNIDTFKVKEISPRALARIMASLFPEWKVDVSESYGLVDTIYCESSPSTYLLNKAYFCVKEATQYEPGTILYLHNGYVLVYHENYKLS